MLLAVDIGNTVTTIGVFQGETLGSTWRISTDVQKLRDEYAMVLLNLLDSEGIEHDAISHACIVRFG